MLGAGPAEDADLVDPAVEVVAGEGEVAQDQRAVAGVGPVGGAAGDLDAVPVEDLLAGGVLVDRGPVVPLQVRVGLGGLEVVAVQREVEGLVGVDPQVQGLVDPAVRRTVEQQRLDAAPGLVALGPQLDGEVPVRQVERGSQLGLGAADELPGRQGGRGERQGVARSVRPGVDDPAPSGLGVDPGLQAQVTGRGDVLLLAGGQGQVLLLAVEQEGPAGHLGPPPPAAAAAGDRRLGRAVGDGVDAARGEPDQAGAGGQQDPGPGGLRPGPVVADQADLVAGLDRGARRREGERLGAGEVVGLRGVAGAADHEVGLGRDRHGGGPGQLHTSARHPGDRPDRHRPAGAPGQGGGHQVGLARQRPPGLGVRPDGDREVAAAGRVAVRDLDGGAVQGNGRVAGEEGERAAVPGEGLGTADDAGVVVHGEELVLGAAEVQHDVAGAAVQQCGPVGAPGEFEQAAGQAQTGGVHRQQRHRHRQVVVPLQGGRQAGQLVPGVLEFGLLGGQHELQFGDPLLGCARLLEELARGVQLLLRREVRHVHTRAHGQARHLEQARVRGEAFARLDQVG